MRLVSDNAPDAILRGLVESGADAAAFAVAATMGCTASAEDKPGYTDTPMLPDGKWRVHDPDRPYPEEVTPGAVHGAPPSDAIVLFDGTSLAAWQPQATPWPISDGAATSSPRRPTYWFESRQRYFQKNFGFLATLLADIFWLLAYSSLRIRARIQNKHLLDPPHFIKDFIRNSSFSRGRCLK